MLNRIFLAIVLLSILLAGWQGRMGELNTALFDGIKGAVELAIGLVGAMAFFLGLMKVAEDGGLLRILARALAPIMRRLFPRVPADHPAMSAMILNIASNMLGLANAATPFGIRAMEHLDSLNARKGTATNAMVLFLAINTAGLALLPTGVMALRASLGSEAVAAIMVPTWLASGTATVVGVTAAFLLARLYRASEPDVVQAARPTSDEASAPALDGDDAAPAPSGTASTARTVAALVFVALFVALAVRDLASGGASGEDASATMTRVTPWFIPAIVASILTFGWVRGVKVYESLVEGATQGFQVALRIIPYLVAILGAVAMFRASGGIDLIVRALAPVTAPIGMPAEALPMALLRPLSGSGAYGVMAEIMSTHGPDSLIGIMVSTFQGSTETTFYVLAVYFGAVGVKDTRHALPACLLADVAGILAAVLVVNALFG